MAFWSRILTAVVLNGTLALCAHAQDTVWTAVIPQGFPGNIYTWHLKPDGSYQEDGHDRRSGAAVQPTLSGRWSMSGGHMMLKQDGIGYTFDGMLVGGEYLGILYLDGKRFSRFCVVRGDAPPKSCADVSA